MGKTVPDPNFVRQKRYERQQQAQWLCRVGGHRVGRNRIVVQYGPHVGICGSCILRWADRTAEGRLQLANYWLRHWPEATRTRSRLVESTAVPPYVDKEEESGRGTQEPVLV